MAVLVIMAGVIGGAPGWADDDKAYPPNKAPKTIIRQDLDQSQRQQQDVDARQRQGQRQNSSNNNNNRNSNDSNADSNNDNSNGVNVNIDASDLRSPFASETASKPRTAVLADPGAKPGQLASTGARILRWGLAGVGLLLVGTLFVSFGDRRTGF